MAGKAIVAKRRGPGIEPRSSWRRKLSRTVTFQFSGDCPNNTSPSTKPPRAQAAPANALQKKAATVLPGLRSPISLRPARVKRVKGSAPWRGTGAATTDELTVAPALHSPAHKSEAPARARTHATE